MKLKRIGAVVTLAVATGLILSSCSLLPSVGGNEGDDKPGKGTSAPSKPSDEGTDDEGTGSDAPSETIAAPGSKVGLNEWLSYDYTGVDDVKAVIAARLVSVTPATDAQAETIIEAIPDAAGYDFVFFKVEQKKVSGADIAFNADYTAFNPVSANGERVQDVTLIGWDECKSVSFTEEFDKGETITQCVVGAYKDGSAMPAGVNYSEFDTAYDYYDGKPLLFIK